MSRSVSAPSSVTKTSPCWNGLIVPGSTFRYGSNFWALTERPRDFSRRPSDAATIPLPSAETTPPVTNTYLATGSNRSRLRGRTDDAGPSALGKRREELRAAGHALELLTTQEVVELLDPRVGRVSRDLLHSEVAIGHARDLREVRDCEHLGSFRESLQRRCHRVRSDAADPGVDLVEHESLAPGDCGQRERDAGELAARCRLGSGSERKTGVRPHEERGVVGACRADLAFTQLDEELPLPHAERLQLGCDRVGKRACVAAARLSQALRESDHLRLGGGDRMSRRPHGIAPGRETLELHPCLCGPVEEFLVRRRSEPPLEIRDALELRFDFVERPGLGFEGR